jgi:hypothetical protein
MRFMNMDTVHFTGFGHGLGHGHWTVFTELDSDFGFWTFRIFGLWTLLDF